MCAVDHFAEWRVLRDVEELRARLTVVIDAADENGQRGQSLSGSLVHPSLQMFAFFRHLNFGVADRAGRNPYRPASRIIECSARDVQIKGSDREQFVLEVLARSRHGCPFASTVAGAPDHA
jgi:hypothetical protein